MIVGAGGDSKTRSTSDQLLIPSVMPEQTQRTAMGIDLHIVDRDAATVRLVEAAKQMEKRALAAPKVRREQRSRLQSLQNRHH
jgi:hypothetical protein